MHDEHTFSVQAFVAITAPKRPPPPLPPEAIAHRIRWARITWGNLVLASVQRHAEEVRRWAHRWALDEAIRRRIRELPVAAQAA